MYPLEMEKIAHKDSFLYTAQQSQANTACAIHFSRRLCSEA